MDTKFYRKPGILSSLIKKPEFSDKKIIFLVIFIPLLLFILLNNKGLIQRIKLEFERKKLNQQVQVEEQKQKKFQEEIFLLKTSNEKIEKIAREKFNMKKPWETIYKKQSNKEATK